MFVGQVGSTLGPQIVSSGPRQLLLDRCAIGQTGQNGVYTCCVRARSGSSGGWQTVQREFHLRRILYGAAELQLGRAPEVVQDEFEEAINDATGAARLFKQPADRLLITLLASEEQRIEWHCMPLPLPSFRVASVGVSSSRFPNRQDRPFVKGSKWVLDRLPLEEERDRLGVDELILVDSTGGGMLEGLISNFYVILQDGTLQTSCLGILEGSIRELVVQACLDLGISVSFSNPRVEDIGNWVNVFITNVNKPVAHVDKVILPCGSSVEFLEEHPVTCRLRERVLAAMY